MKRNCEVEIWVKPQGKASSKYIIYVYHLIGLLFIYCLFLFFVFFFFKYFHKFDIHDASVYRDNICVVGVVNGVRAYIIHQFSISGVLAKHAAKLFPTIFFFLWLTCHHKYIIIFVLDVLPKRPDIKFNHTNRKRFILDFVSVSEVDLRVLFSIPKDSPGFPFVHKKTVHK